MKILTAFIFLLSTLVVQQDAEAQTRRGRSGSGRVSPSRPSAPRGPSYNPGRGRSTPPSRPSTRPAPSRPSTRPAPSRPTTRPAPAPGPRYNPRPAPSRPTTRPAPRTNRPTTRPAPAPGPRYNPRPAPSRPTTRPAPRYNPNPRSNRRVITRPVRTHYGTPNYHRPYGYRQVSYRHYYHAPYRTPYYHSVRYYRSYDWYNYVLRTNRNYVYAHWIFYPAGDYNNGYRTIDNYPYYVYNGYRHRYSSNDYCNYQLVDSTNHNVVNTYWNQLCNTGYDSCSIERDRLNSQMNNYRYFCSETIRDYGYDYSTPSYESTDYSGNTCSDANRDGMCDDYEESNTCSDNDNDGYCDPGSY